MTKTIAETLSAAADLIEPEGKWTQKFFALDGHGLPLDATSKRAVCFCAEGAIRSVSRRYCGPAELYTDRQLGSLTAWNDRTGRTQAEVVAKLRELAAQAASEGL